MNKDISQRGSRLMRVGIIGSVIAALCCVTPILVLLLGAVGLSWLTGYLDYAVLPALCLFVGLTVYALWRNRAAATPPTPQHEDQ